MFSGGRERVHRNEWVNLSSGLEDVSSNSDRVCNLKMREMFISSIISGQKIVSKFLNESLTHAHKVVWGFIVIFKCSLRKYGTLEQRFIKIQEKLWS